MQTNTKFKTTISCGCKSCKRYSKFKQEAYRWSKRKFRHQVNLQLKNLVDLEEFVTNKVSAGYTD